MTMNEMLRQLPEFCVIANGKTSFRDTYDLENILECPETYQKIRVYTKYEIAYWEELFKLWRQEN